LASIRKHGGYVESAADAAGIGKTAAYELRKDDPEFAEEWERAVREGRAAMIDEMRTSALERATRGVLEPAGWYKGKPGGVVRRYSDNLTMFMLRAHVPDVYNIPQGDPNAGGGGTTPEKQAERIRALIAALDESIPKDGPA